MKETPPQDLQTTIVRYGPYLSEIRKRLLFILVFFIIAAAVGAFYYQSIVLNIMKFYDLKNINITFTSPFQFISLAINVGFVVGIIVVSPLIIYQLISFLKPALKPREYNLGLKILPFSIVLFIAGFLFGTWLMTFVISTYQQQSFGLDIGSFWDINKFFSQFFLTAIFLGILFQFPLVLTLLLRLDIIKYSSVAKQRIPAYVIILIVTTLLPPIDLLSNTLIFSSLVIIFELALLLNRNTKKKIAIKGGD